MFAKYFLSDAPEVLIEIGTPRNGRRVQAISAVLQAMDLNHVARAPFWRPSLAPRVLHKRLAKTDCRLVWRCPSPSRLFITDSATSAKGPKRLLVSYDTRPLLAGLLPEHCLPVPILFNPSLLNLAGYAEADRLASNLDRPIKMIFAGNCEPKSYDNPELARSYGVLSRHRLHRAALESFGSMMFIPESYEQLLDAANAGLLRERFVWIDTARFSIPMSEWLQTLSMSQYFFCAPGVAYPYCHNFNESIACGCVPVLQYGQWMFPRLEHGANCLVFETLEDLRRLVPSIIGGGYDHAWPGMSAAAVSYHAANLSLEHCMVELRVFIEDPTRTTMTWIMAGKE